MANASFADRLHGHLYTVGPRLLARVKPQAEPPFTRWTRRVVEGAHEVALSGLLSEPDGAQTLAIILHGCGGNPQSPYASRLARFLYDAGHAVLRLAWRGADLSGEDLYHAAQTADVHAVLADPVFERYSRVWAIGFSLGGHACLHVAHESRDLRLTAVATVCPVLHLLETNRFIDSPEAAFYRRYTLSGLRAGYVQMHARGRAPSSIEAVRRASTFRAYDALTVVPRYGFASVDDYYERACVSRVLARIERPTLVVSARHDPMLPSHIAERVLPTLSPAVTFRWAERGGHCAFPGTLDLGEATELGLEAQLHAWLTRQG
jgi:predicted alpha/beta-fold hydrolase